MIPATDSSTVSLDAMSGLDEARAWVSGDATATCLDGSTVKVVDDASGVEVVWTPAGTGSVLTITLDMRARTGKTSALTTVTVASGAPLTSEASAADVQSATGGAYYLSGDDAVLRLVGSTDVRIE
jgi:hypothetical protein